MKMTKEKGFKALNVYYIFEKQGIQGFQIYLSYDIDSHLVSALCPCAPCVPVSQCHII